MKNVLIPVLVGLALASCTNPITGGTPVPTTGNLRVVHASVDAGSVDVYVDEKREFDALAFKSTFPATAYKSLLVGAHKLSLCAVNTLTCPVDKAAVDIGAGADKTVLAIGTADKADDTGATPRPLELLTVTDSNVAPAVGNFRLRLIHAASAPAAAIVDVYITKSDVDSITGALPNLSGFKYKDVSSAYIEAAAGSYRVRITGAGSKVSIIDTGAVVLADGRVYTAVAVNPATGVPASGAVLLTDR
jgi:copper chaperone CopZ